MAEWTHIKRYNPVGPDYPEAGRDYVLKSEAEEKIAKLEAEVASLTNGPYVITNSPQMVKDYIDAGAVTDGMVVVIQSKLKEGAP